MHDNTTLFQRIGGEEGIARLAASYVHALDTLPDVRYLRSLYPDDLSHYETRMVEFLSGWLGGPALYQQRHGMPMLRENHRRIPINAQARDEWITCIKSALRQTVADEDLRILLEGVFWRMADSLRHE